MARIDFTALANPFSENDPCGPDLDMRGDEDYLNFVTIAEGLLPTEFFADGAPFDASLIDVDGQIARMAPFLGRTRDIRLLSLLARFLVLDRNLAGFVAVIEAIGRLLEVYWDKVHPSAERGSFSMRAAAIATLNEPTVCFPLQYMRLCEDRRFGVITLRTRMYAKGEAKPREGDTTPSYPSILQALRECPTDHFDATRNLIARLAASLARINSLFAEHCGFDKTPGLDKITATVAAMTALLDEAVPTEEQKQLAASGGVGQTGTYGSIRNAFGAHMALQAVIDYFTHHEPSSPALPLIVQARELQGKTFVEVMQTLLPSKTSNAAYWIGDPKVFALPLERLAAIMPSIDSYALESDSTGSCPEGGSPVSDALVPPPVLNQDASAALARGEDGGVEFAPSHAAGEAPTKDESTLAAAADSPTMQATGRLQFAAATRQEALSVLNEVVQYLRTAEPSSPIPWLIDRAQELADRDFLSVLSSLLPEDALP
jgi:type VI secretion system protein ImpA